MRTHRIAPRLLAAALLAAVCGWSAEAAPGAGTSVSGIAKGIWQLPEPQYATGTAEATLYPLGPGPVLAFRAKLTEIVSPCLSCREGDLVGTLNDGVGSSPDFIVNGHWLASQLSGQGSFESLIWKAGSTSGVPVGKLEGDFNDPPFPPGFPGPLSGMWTLRR
jgi:hypothetical protein